MQLLMAENLWPEVDIEDPDSDEDRQGNQRHAEEEVLAQQGHSKGCWGDDLSKQQEEHGQWEEDRNTQSHLHSITDGI